MCINIFCTMFQGDLDYIKFWSSVEKEEEKHVVANIQEGLKELGKGNTIMYSSKGVTCQQ